MIGMKYILTLEKITNVECAKRMGVVTSLVSSWTNGKKKIPDARIIQFHKLFPIYPKEYISKELTEAEQVSLHNIKYKQDAIDSQADAAFIRINDIISHRMQERQAVVSEIRELLNVSEISQIIDGKIISKAILIKLFDAVSTENQIYLHDYKALNSLEQERKGALNTPPSMLISIVLSALCMAYGIDDDIDIFPDDKANAYARKRRNELFTVFRRILTK